MGVTVLARGLVLPLVRRFQVAEGMLLAVNASLIFVQRTRGERAVALAAHSLAVLGLMYALNDWWDARRDLINPRKDQALARDLSAHRGTFLAMLLLGHAAAIASALCFGPQVALITAGVFAANVAYTALFKGIPVVDVALVGLWGALYTSLVGPSSVVIAVGAMTAASHVFQAMGDRSADLQAGVTTIAASRALALCVLLGCCLVLAFGLRPLIGALALVGFAPFLAAMLIRRSLLAWMASKAVFGLAWLMVLWHMYGSR